MTTTYGPSNDRIPAGELTLSKHMARIELDNAKLATATPAQKRVIIAKDVLSWLKLGKLRAQPGTYLSVTDSNDRWIPDAAKVNGWACNACALGAVFAVAVERNLVNASCSETPDFSMRSLLTLYFARDQLLAIENAFEMWTHKAGGRFCSGRGYSEDPSLRMEAIMKNIITHRGTFVY